MLTISNNAIKRFGSPLEKYFLLKINFNNNPKFYSNDSVIVNDFVNNTEFYFKGTISNEISLKNSLNIKDKSIDRQSITVNIIDSFNFFDFSKLHELNLINAELLFITSNMDYSEAIKLYEGILSVNSVELENEYFNFSITSKNDKFNKTFPPNQINSLLSYCLVTFDAEKYIGESIPIVFGLIPYPGYPIPLFYDDNSIRRYAIANHNVVNDATFKVYADGIELSSSYYTKVWDVTNSIFYIQTSGTNYINYFKGKKITCSCKGLLYTSDNPKISDVIKYMLLNYSYFSLKPSLIDESYIDFQGLYLNNFKVARFFNGISTVFDSIEELQNDFPFCLYDRDLKKTILSLDINSLSYNNIFLNTKHSFERIKGISISKPDELFNIFTIRYKYDALNNRWLGYKKRDRFNDSKCLSCYNRIGYERDYGVLDLYSVYDDNVAEKILDYLVSMFSINLYYLTYKCLHNQIMYELMDGILLIDEDLGIDRKKFIVINKVIDRKFVYLTFRNTEIIS